MYISHTGKCTLTHTLNFIVLFSKINVIPVFYKVKVEGREFKLSLNYLESSKLGGVTWDPVSKKTEVKIKIKLVMMESQKEMTSELVLEAYLYLQSDFW